MALNQLDGLSSLTRLVRTFRRDQSCCPLPGEGHRTNYHRIAGCSKSPAEISLADELRIYCWKYKHRSCYVWENSKIYKSFLQGSNFELGAVILFFKDPTRSDEKCVRTPCLDELYSVWVRNIFWNCRCKSSFSIFLRKKMAWIHLSVILSWIALEFWLVNSIIWSIAEQTHIWRHHHQHTIFL